MVLTYLHFRILKFPLTFAPVPGFHHHFFAHQRMTSCKSKHPESKVKNPLVMSKQRHRKWPQKQWICTLKQCDFLQLCWFARGYTISLKITITHYRNIFSTWEIGIMVYNGTIYPGEIKTPGLSIWVANGWFQYCSSALY